MSKKIEKISEIPSSKFTIFFMLFYIIIFLYVGIVSYIQNQNQFFITGFNIVFESIIMFLIFIYLFLTIDYFKKLLWFPFHYLVKEVKKEKFNKKYFNNVHTRYIISSIFPSIIFCLIGIIYLEQVRNTFTQELFYKFYLQYLPIYILLISITSILIFDKKKEFKKKLFTKLNILLISLAIIFSFVSIQVDKLNETDLSFVSYLNCTYPTASKNVVVIDHKIDCIFSNYNSSSNYSIEFHNKYLKLKNRKNITVSNTSLELIFPNKENSYYIRLIENDKIFMEFNEINVVSYEKFYDVKEQIKIEKNNLFVGGWIAFFTVLFFTLEFNRKKENKD